MWLLITKSLVQLRFLTLSWYSISIKMFVKYKIVIILKLVFFTLLHAKFKTDLNIILDNLYIFSKFQYMADGLICAFIFIDFFNIRSLYFYEHYYPKSALSSLIFCRVILMFVFFLCTYFIMRIAYYGINPTLKDMNYIVNLNNHYEYNFYQILLDRVPKFCHGTIYSVVDADRYLGHIHDFVLNSLKKDFHYIYAEINKLSRNNCLLLNLFLYIFSLCYVSYFFGKGKPFKSKFGRLI